MSLPGPPTARECERYGCIATPSVPTQSAQPSHLIVLNVIPPARDLELSARGLSAACVTDPFPGVRPMKVSSLLAFLFIGVIIFYVTGGGLLFSFIGGRGGGSGNSSRSRPAAVQPTSGTQQANPFMAESESSQ